jgi:hypothetical protein
MAISRLQASLAAATNEVTVAAANINFDFTLVKFEAPKEYQALGGVLSKKRKRNAEYGSSHITARQLGALFEDVCSPTPKLVKAYGTRVSEIARLATESSLEYSNSLFGTYSGVDGTSIWAAATSSKASLHVHLLSCMLARVFESPEAISIWVELIKERREFIAKNLEDGASVPFSLAAAAAQQEITRTRLAEWDASARAWLRTADKIKEKQQTQLRLVLDNIHLPVNSKQLVFSSVIEAWKSALQTMESLICGMPQAVNDGAALVGLSAWHLYPDIAVFGRKTVEVCMADELVARGGVMSLGLSHPREEAEQSGVYWSLSLAHLRYYGRPVSSTRNMAANPRTITFPQLTIANLGALLGIWKVSTNEIALGIQILGQIGELLGRSDNLTGDNKWTNTLVNGVAAFSKESSYGEDMAIRLINLGRMRGTDWIPKPEGGERHWPFFRLLEIDSILACMKGPEERILLLRRLASKIPGFEKLPSIIKWTALRNKPVQPSYVPMGMDSPTYEDPENYATAIPSVPMFNLLRGHFGIATHHRWSDSELNHRTDVLYKVKDLDNFRFDVDSKLKQSNHRGIRTSAVGGDVSKRLPSNTSSSTVLEICGCKLEIFLGVPGDGAIYASKRHALDHNVPHPYPNQIPLQVLLWCLQEDLISPEKLEELLRTRSRTIIDTLGILNYGAQVYKNLPDGRISTKTLSRPMLKTKFGKLFDGRRAFGSSTHPFQLSLWFIAYFEDCHDIDIELLKNAIAVSVADSIYFPERVSYSVVSSIALGHFKLIQDSLCAIPIKPHHPFP